jgi:ferredoxin
VSAAREARVARTARQAPHAPGEARLRIDPSVCDGVGICAHLAPDLIAVDSWGYPILDPAPLASKSELRQATAAVKACPRSALYLDS